MVGGGGMVRGGDYGGDNWEEGMCMWYLDWILLIF